MSFEFKKDREATKAARKAKLITDYDSWISNAGHIYVAGRDKSDLRERVYIASKFCCYICHEFCPEWDGDLEHFKSGRPLVRCDCFHRILADGTECTNVGWVHSMFSRTHACHRKKHNREIKWTPRSNS